MIFAKYLKIFKEKTHEQGKCKRDQRRLKERKNKWVKKAIDLGTIVNTITQKNHYNLISK